MSFDPYRILGLARDATPEQIKGAYRRLAKDTHPDHGGTAEGFQAVNRAYAILADAARRARFDTTGVADDLSADNLNAGAQQIIAAMVGGILVAEGDPVYDDLVAVMQNHLQKEMNQLKTRISQARAAATRAKALRDRFTGKAKKPNLLHSLIDWHASNAEASIFKMKDELLAHERAAEILKDYAFNREARQEAGFVYYQNDVFSSATTGSA